MATPACFENMLDHPNIELVLNADYREVEKIIVAAKSFTPVRSMSTSTIASENCLIVHCNFEHETLDCERFQPAAVVNYPNDFTLTPESLSSNI